MAAVQAMISSVSPPQLIQLLDIKNNSGLTVTDLRLTLYNELHVQMSQGNAGLPITFTYFCKLMR